MLLEKATWDYIAIQDHDDLWHPRKLQAQVDFLQAHMEYMGCGTTTMMYYEADNRYFEYTIKSPSYYTLHPSVMYRRVPSFRYDTTNNYMCDAYSLKYNLCGGKKLLANIPHPLTIHIIKGNYSNMSYQWFSFSWANMRRIVDIHGYTPYSALAIGYELVRKPWIAMCRKMGWSAGITWFDQLPFRLMRKKMRQSKDVKKTMSVFWDL
jgi:glycosyltransferase involved in cell wall biosynthesis